MLIQLLTKMLNLQSQSILEQLPLALLSILISYFNFYQTYYENSLGTGMRASVHVRLPLLSNDEKRFKAIASKHHLDIRGIDGEHSESKGGK